LTVAFNQNFLQPNLAIQLTPVPWLAFSSTSAYIAGSGSEEVDVTFNPTGLAAGTYGASLLVNTTDPLLPVTTLPVSLTILSVAPVLTVQSALPNVILSWPVAYGTNFSLEQNADLTTTNWSNVVQSVVVTNGFNTVTVPVPGNTFFRLIQ
jgi:hypothetical protein